ncbi:hypothetical protein ABK040_010844 [Willaertia magna]
MFAVQQPSLVTSTSPRNTSPRGLTIKSSILDQDIVLVDNHNNNTSPTGSGSPIGGLVNISDSLSLMKTCGEGGISESFVIENVTVKDCLEIITDYEKYPDFLEGHYSSKVLSRTNSLLEVYQKSIVMFNVMEYTIKVSMDSDGVTWIESGETTPFKKFRGGWRLSQLDNGNVEATYYLNIEFQTGVPIPVKEWLSKKGIPVTLQAFKRRIEEHSTKKKIKQYYNDQSVLRQRSCHSLM